MTMQYKKVLVAVDGSKEAEWALKKAIEVCKRNHAELVIGHVIDTRNYPTLEAYDMTIRDRAEEFAGEILNKYKAIADKEGIQAVTEIELGSPKVKITKSMAVKHNVDLIMCGATGLNAVERFLIGSVSENIVRTSPCDVLIIRSEKEN
ncbi:universal stress protein [Peribacillus psychrosaccharolyticus]|uniref:Universal stress protein n=1 Tax=Peribacillus psychrosaccharolyticus TaxID=1407 RepID=A0A974NKT2_PERPY|nr:universal stress protein [Peribacillus psychrosaccharolyticus]MEC2054712.1 universal stress protein [Peribacillus psychrosaccharolyticus]MED3744061.1 universal stress protein [Peribacillus psychrosaccharolyticus]QQS99556.1 universal stress protein [Peribacillus psychrosaccharolyticus]